MARDKAIDPGFRVLSAPDLKIDDRSDAFAAIQLALPGGAWIFSTLRRAIPEKWHAMRDDAMAFISNDTRSSALERASF